MTAYVIVLCSLLILIVNTLIKLATTSHLAAKILIPFVLATLVVITRK